MPQENENEDRYKAPRLLQEYRDVLSNEEKYKSIAFEEIGRNLELIDIESNYEIFRKYLPFIKKHFNENNPFNMNFILRKIENDNKTGKLLLERGFDLFDKYPDLLEFYFRYGYESPEGITEGKNMKSNVRLMFPTYSDMDYQRTLEEIKNNIEDNISLYSRLDNKFKGIGERELIIARISGEAEVCVRFIRRSEKSEKHRKFMVLIRPTIGGSQFANYTFDLSAMGYTGDTDKTGFLFLAPPNNTIDEKALLELIASEKSDEEIQTELNKGAMGVEQFIFDQPPIL